MVSFVRRTYVGPRMGRVYHGRDDEDAMWLFFLFLFVPLVEIALFIQIGGLIGLWPTLGVVVLTAIFGTYLVRSQGSAELKKLRSSFGELRDPTESLAFGAMILFSGALLLTPGFFTDAVGFLLLIPAFRSFLLRHLKQRVKFQSFQMGAGTGGVAADDVVQADYEDVTSDSPNR